MDRYYMLYQIVQLRQTREERNSLPTQVQTESQPANSNTATLSVYPGLEPAPEGVASWLYPVPYTPMTYPIGYELVPMAGYRHGLFSLK